MKPRTTVSELHEALHELRRLAVTDSRLTPDFRRGYIHLLDQVVEWCNPNEPVVMTTVAPTRQDN